MQRYIIDRFEEDFAVLEKEEGGTIDMLKSDLPECEEGDVLLLENGIYFVDREETQRRRELITEKIRKVFEK